MRLITKEIEKRLEKYPLYSQEDKGENAEVLCKFFTPIGSWTWYVLEAQKSKEVGYEFFGIVVNGYGEREYGYFTLHELEEIRLPWGLKIERDLYFSPTKVKNLK